MPTKIFSLAAMSLELRCQCPLVTPASLNGNGCAPTAPAANVDASTKAANNVVFMDASLLEPICGCWAAIGGESYQLAGTSESWAKWERYGPVGPPRGW